MCRVMNFRNNEFVGITGRPDFVKTLQGKKFLVNKKSSAICLKHFTAKDFERCLTTDQLRGFDRKFSRTLRQDEHGINAFPTIYPQQWKQEDLYGPSSSSSPAKATKPGRGSAHRQFIRDVLREDVSLPAVSENDDQSVPEENEQETFLTENELHFTAKDFERCLTTDQLGGFERKFSRTLRQDEHGINAFPTIYPQQRKQEDLYGPSSSSSPAKATKPGRGSAHRQLIRDVLREDVSLPAVSENDDQSVPEENEQETFLTENELINDFSTQTVCWRRAHTCVVGN
ncbi:uncharacterized protein LOC135694779 [Rhopilema esculentum]|uniref:uncharacterized protein LOC135694779 n=1 Tax=Rhopilema esculentum TaxID=499914 RepID=UPI0031CF530C